MIKKFSIFCLIISYSLIANNPFDDIKQAILDSDIQYVENFLKKEKMSELKQRYLIGLASQIVQNRSTDYSKVPAGSSSFGEGALGTVGGAAAGGGVAAWVGMSVPIIVGSSCGGGALGLGAYVVYIKCKKNSEDNELKRLEEKQAVALQIQRMLMNPSFLKSSEEVGEKQGSLNSAQ